MKEKTKKYYCIIIGGGISGITAAIYLKQANKEVLLIEKSTLGGVLNKISTIKNYPGNPGISGPDLAYNLYKQVVDLKVEVLADTVINIKHLKTCNKVILKDKELTCKLAPNATKRFFELLEKGYYGELKFIFDNYVTIC